jgi:hypothetical protein
MTDPRFDDILDVSNNLASDGQCPEAIELLQSHIERLTIDDLDLNLTPFYLQLGRAHHSDALHLLSDDDSRQEVEGSLRSAATLRSGPWRCVRLCPYCAEQGTCPAATAW